MIELVSICIPCYNSSRFIIKTLNSVQKQSYKNIELIVIDDDSSDFTFELIQEWARGKNWVSIFKNESNLGIVKTANKLLEHSNGDYIQFLGHDDILLENKIEKQIKFFQELSEEVAMIYSNVSIIDEDDKIIEKDYLAYQGYDSENMQYDDITARLLSFNFIPAISVLIKSGCLKKMGPFDESLSFEDLDMWLRISLNYKIEYFPQITALYRRNKNSLMNDNESRINIMSSVLDCREKYRNLNPEWDKIIDNGIVKSAPSLYRYNHPSAKYWIRKRLKYDKHFKSWIYWLLSRFRTKTI